MGEGGKIGVGWDGGEKEAGGEKVRKREEGKRER